MVGDGVHEKKWKMKNEKDWDGARNKRRKDSLELGLGNEKIGKSDMYISMKWRLTS